MPPSTLPILIAISWQFGHFLGYRLEFWSSRNSFILNK